MSRVIHVFKGVEQSGKVSYCFGEKETRAPGQSSFLETLAKNVKSYVLIHDVQIRIDLFPEHDIQFFYGDRWMRCFPLNEMEKERFWEYFISDKQ